MSSAPISSQDATTPASPVARANRHAPGNGPRHLSVDTPPMEAHYPGAAQNAAGKSGEFTDELLAAIDCWFQCQHTNRGAVHSDTCNRSRAIFGKAGGE